MHIKKNVNSKNFIEYLICAIPIIVILYCFSGGISGNDFWWHVKVGEYIVQTKAIPSTDIFSWYGVENQIAWTAHEWLADVVFYGIHSCFSEFGVFVFSVLGAIILFFLMKKETKAYMKRNVLFAGVFFALYGVLSNMFFYGRPHVFSYFLLFFELKILYGFFCNNEDKKIYMLPLLSVLWSNLHGGSSSLSYLLCIVFFVVGMFGFDFGRIEAQRISKKGLIKLAGVTVATILGIMVNPIGVKVLAYPYINLSDELSMTLISEWHAPDAKLIGNLVLFFFPILLMTIGIISENRKIRLIDLIVMLLFMFLFFRSVRFVMLWYISACFYAFPYLPELRVKEITKGYEKVAVGVAMVLLVVLGAMSCFEICETAKAENLISKVASEEAMEIIKTDAPERLFNDYNLGEALIYHDIPVFFDARADLYAQDNLMADGVSLMFLEQANVTSGQPYVEVDDLFQKYEFDAVVILKVRPLFAYIISHPEQFECVYEDDELGYFRVTEVYHEEK